MTKLNLHFNTSVTLSPNLVTAIMNSLLQQTDIKQLYIEHRKAVRKQYEELQRVDIKPIDAIYVLKGDVQIAMSSEVTKVTESDVYIETTAMSMIEYAERTRKFRLQDYKKRHPPIQ